jgi:hypothetical protein
MTHPGAPGLQAAVAIMAPVYLAAAFAGLTRARLILMEVTSGTSGLELLQRIGRGAGCPVTTRVVRRHLCRGGPSAREGRCLHEQIDVALGHGSRARSDRARLRSRRE